MLSSVLCDPMNIWVITARFLRVMLTVIKWKCRVITLRFICLISLCHRLLMQAPEIYNTKISCACSWKNIHLCPVKGRRHEASAREISIRKSCTLPCDIQHFTIRWHACSKHSTRLFQSGVDDGSQHSHWSKCTTGLISQNHCTCLPWLNRVHLQKTDKCTAKITGRSRMPSQ